MKRKLQFALVAVAGLIYGQTVNAQVTYDFDIDLTGVSTPGGAGGGAGTPVVGVISTPALLDNSVANTTKVLRQQTDGVLTNQTCVNDLTLITADTDYNITWKEYITANASLKKGFLLRGTGSGTYALGIKTGYYCMVQNNASGSVTFRIFNISATALTQIATSAGINLDGTGVVMTINRAYWYRASVTGNVIKMDYSTNGTTWVNGITYTDALNLYPNAGLTQTVSGIGGSYTSHYIDDITYRTGAPLGISSVSLEEKSIVVFKKDNTISINSTEMAIKSVQLFDINGRVIASKNSVNALETSFTNLNIAPGIILIKVTGTDNKVVTRKLLY
jgi:hypothetical protein